MTMVHLVRHAKTANQFGLAYGRFPNYQLSELGRAQAGQAAEYLHERWQVSKKYTDHRWELVSSPLARAQETAGIIARRIDVPQVSTDDRLIEWATAMQAQNFGPGHGTWLSPRGWWLMRNPLKPSWGEPYREVAERMHAMVRSVLAGPEVPNHVVVVSHELTIGVYVRYLTGRPLWHDPSRRGVALASVHSVFFHDNGQPLSIEYWQPPKIELKKEKSHG
jgi:broad specificity phosphatase PhoE